MNEITLAPVAENATRLADFLDGVFEAGSVPPVLAAKLNVAADDVFSNICRYSGASDVQIQAHASDGKVWMSFTDDGVPYDPTAPQPPVDITSGADEREPGGLGIFLVRRIMDRLTYRWLDGRNLLVMEKAYAAPA